MGPLQGNYTSNVAQFFINLVTYWILYSYLVPISLFVTMEIVKFWQVRYENAASPSRHTAVALPRGLSCRVPSSDNGRECPLSSCHAACFAGLCFRQ